MTDHAFPLAGVIGYPIGHSKSPRLHRYWLGRYGIAGDYVPLPVSDDNLRHVLHTLPRMGFVGVNITIPHKVTVMSIADQVTDRATLIGAANTLIFGSDGRIYADNTDGYGFIANLKQGAPDWDPSLGPATVLGAGGAARAVISSLIDAGVPHIFLSNRTRPKAETLKQDFGSRIEVVDWVKAGNVIEDSTTLVNTTSLGMQGAAEFRVPLDGLRPGTLVTDLVYAPLRTKLLETAEAMGCQTVDGLGMLLHQAVPAFERWFGRRPEVDDATRNAILS
ncbi:shikimate dehydrogenase [Ponticoccus sp. SC2-23]|uniref:shikimate dehydrogenase n=1 Tax=Alexandriicola marinus TaxID=2081710 RepID=UPI000FDA7F76|nr:shikimate dehydrogenase [Alexandriicola marinus]MBM1220729.1 shikimate dehydrogenase [Ponticoccus sp. SC6-9]MBM1225988.1 shikimate dehydrogenase [Ponticoccus sp. SC6-15]MBM1231285.1 shikimate dehydrogenase [Ponticoccus sp. SC6-38]MBM1235854.1 shikimate dehydrogenase [Ponticoccus sp. SC6-45]MBM1240308.1 shikimate dehydrogenase [Ponticoccus sp. SC6-49]MBM1244843.1 shikimate dehydrogenase [Ponticoccus sp. SC2-64]MBM1249328.1 shikimate dehydrogenase [Ponticoccus sp. SC6-42]MBM1252384.1 shiki